MPVHKLAASVLLLSVLFIAAANYLPDIPKTWDMKEIKRFHVPPYDRKVAVTYVPEEIYYALPEYKLYKTYPVYIYDKMPEGYLDSLKSLPPEIAVDFSKLTTDEDWIEAGRLVFEMPPNRSPYNALTFESAWVDSVGYETTKDGILPYLSYIQTPEGLKLGSTSCANCHTKILDNGQVVVGGQGDYPFDREFAFIIKKFDFPVTASMSTPLVYAPWSDPSVKEAWAKEDFVQTLMSTPPGVMTRQGTGTESPVAVPSLFGIRDIKYFDRTGLMKNENIGDLMRYAAFNQGMDMFTQYGAYIPMNGISSHSQITTEQWDHPFGYDAGRYSDEQLYALAMYLYSLEAPENPEKSPAEVLARGEVIFAEQGCVTCHTPPAFTNNMLLPATADFEIPDEDKETLDIFNVSVETDPYLSTKTRRGTGYYKVPSLRGLWMREAFFHDGSLTSIEEVLDPARLEPDYIPTGHVPVNKVFQGVPGHPFGMELSPDDKDALIAYLKSL